jgi:hypothetical protein
MSEVVLIRCVGCGTPLGQAPYTAAHVAHAASCPKHPLAAEVAALREELSTRRAQVESLIEANGALRERAEAAERGLSPCVDDDGTPFASARTWRAAHAAAEARASLLERERDEARGALDRAVILLRDVLPYAEEGWEWKYGKEWRAEETEIAHVAALGALPPTRGGGNEGRGAT